MSTRILQDRRQALRAVEFSLLYLAAPLAHLAFFEQLGLFAPLAAITVIGVGLLALTPEFSWRELIDVSELRRWLPFVLIFTLGALAIVGTLVLTMVPHQLLGFPRYRPQLWAMVMLLYPLISVLAQEIYFRKLFFRRYSGLFTSGATRILVNGGAFALAHLFYQNLVAVGVTMLAGLIFAWVYERSRSFPLVVVLHSLGGQIIFTLGLGSFFYHGAIA